MGEYKELVGHTIVSIEKSKKSENEHFNITFDNQWTGTALFGFDLDDGNNTNFDVFYNRLIRTIVGANKNMQYGLNFGPLRPTDTDDLVLWIKRANYGGDVLLVYDQNGKHIGGRSPATSNWL